MQKETFIKQYAAGLNPQQLAAVQAVHGPVLLLAVPGSGKTTVLVTRLGYMVLCCDVPPAHFDLIILMDLLVNLNGNSGDNKRFAGKE